MCAAPDKDWIDMLSVLSTPIIAIITGIVIGLLQWHINKMRLHNELFNRRIDLYNKIASYIANILTSGSLKDGGDIQFLADTRHATFIFGEDIKEFVEKIYHKSRDFNLLKAQRQSDESLSKQEEIFGWFKDELNNMQNRFIKYLKL